MNTFCEITAPRCWTWSRLLELPPAIPSRTRFQPRTSHLTPVTLHPTPNTIHPTPYALRPAPYTLHSAPHAPRPTPTHHRFRGTSLMRNNLPLGPYGRPLSKGPRGWGGGFLWARYPCRGPCDTPRGGDCMKSLQAQNLALTVSYVPYSLDSGGCTA